MATTPENSLVTMFSRWWWLFTVASLAVFSNLQVASTQEVTGTYTVPEYTGDGTGFIGWTIEPTSGTAWAPSAEVANTNAV